MRPDEADPDFAPANPTDGREPLDWVTKYPEEAKSAIQFEARYLAILLSIIPFAMVCLWLKYPQTLLKISDAEYKPILQYGLAWLAGVLGGTLFDIKWLYHSVARQIWNKDRRLWRLFTPHISGGLAFAVVALISSGVFRIFDRKAAESNSLIVGVGFMVGYFSDNAVAKLAEIADTLFGATRLKKPGRIAEGDDANPTSTSGAPDGPSGNGNRGS